jgi:type IV pilus assembly protein PilC
MGSYRFQVRANDGQLRSGVMQADNAGAAAAILRNQGVHVMSIDSLKGTSSSGSLYDSFKKLNAGKPNQKHVLDFTTQLAVMIRAGINLRSALDGIADQTVHAGFKKVIVDIKQDVESGKQFSDALAKHPKLFGALYINMVRARTMLM